MELDQAEYAGFKAKINQIDKGIEVVYYDAEGKQLDREVFTGISDYGLKKEHVDSRLKKFWEHRLDSN